MRELSQTTDNRRASRLALLLGLSVLSVVLIVENRLLGWELWVVPLLAAGLAAAWVLLIWNGLPGESVTLVFSGMLMLETFYYGVHCDAVYRLTPVAIVAAMLYALTMRRRLVVTGIIVGYATLLFRVAMDIASGDFVADGPSVFILLANMCLPAFGGFVTLRYIELWNLMQDSYRRQQQTLDGEREKINDFLTNISHEIRTPVNAIIGMSKLMEREPLPQPVHSDVLAVQEAGHRIASELGDILDYTEINMDKLVVAEEPYMLASVIGDLLAERRWEHSDRVELVVDVDPGAPAVLTGDAPKLRKILRHLIENGEKYTDEGCVYAHISARPRPYGVNLVIEVTDTGVGLDDEIREHLSESFYKHSSGRTQSSGGLGIGLPIVMGFARLMDGFVRIDGRKDRGTTVTVSVPQAVSDPAPCMSVENRDAIRLAGCFDFKRRLHPAVRDAYWKLIRNAMRQLDMAFNVTEDWDALRRLLRKGEITHLFMDAAGYEEIRDEVEEIARSIAVIVIAEEDYEPEGESRVHLLRKPFSTFQAVAMLGAPGAEPAAGREETVRFPGVRALVVDDEPTNLMVAEGILKGYGMEVSLAGNGPQALRMYARAPFDIVFMDHMMPGMDGVETARRLRNLEREKGGKLCIVALTANTVSSARELFREEGFDGFIAKPIDVLELERVLRRALPRAAAIMPEGGEALRANAGSGGWEALKAALEALGVDTGEGVGYCAGDRDFYRKVLKQYAGDADRRADELETFFAAKDWDNYAIRVHAVKSTSRLIGARALSELAAGLESAAKEGREAELSVGHPQLMPRYLALAGAILPLVGEPRVEGAAGESPDPVRVRCLLEELLACLEDYDADGAEERLGQLKAAEPGRADVAEQLQKARRQVDDFELSGAAESVRLALRLWDGGMDA